jgi:hypothetical protein
MSSLLPEFPGLRSRLRLLFATLIVAAGLLLGAVGAQAKPNDPPVDFLMELNATSASFTPSADTPGAYELVLRGVPNEVGVTELTRAKTTATLPIGGFMAYWTAYGDETGQFETNPPRAVLQAADAAGNLQEVVVRLSNGSRNGMTVRFDAEIITNENVQDALDAKVDKVVQTEPSGEPVLVTEPTTLTDVELYVDMPQRITQPEADTEARLRAGQARSNPQTWMPNGGTCNGVYSSRLRNCWQNIPSFGTIWSTASYFTRFVDGRGFAYDNVGEVDLGGYYWSPQSLLGIVPTPPRVESQGRGFRFFGFGDWYGVHRNGTSRCTWFMARWSAHGKCW